MNRITWIVYILLIMVALLVAGCAGQTSQPASTQPAGQAGTISKLVIGTTNMINDININDYYFGIFRARTSHQGLVTLNPDGSYAPCLAQSWNSADGKTWTFNLIKNATWQDGVPLTAEDIKFTLEYIPAKMPAYKQLWGQIDSIRTPDNYTVVVTLKTPNSNFLANLLVMNTIPEHVFKDVADPAKYNDINATIGSGPYKFVSFDKDAGIVTFKAYDGYWGGKPAVDTIEIHIYKNQDTMIMALQKGEIDTTYMYSNGISYYYVPTLLKDDDVKISTINSTGVTALFFNTEKPALDNATFRKAVSYAIDYKELMNLFTAGYGEPATAGFLASGNYNYEDKGLLVQDINKSKELLDSIGMVDRDGDGFRETPGGQRFRVELLARSDIPDHPRLAEMIGKYLEAAGIDVNVKLVDSSTFLQTANVAKDYDMLVSYTSPWGMMAWAGYGSDYVDNRTSGWAQVNDPVYAAIVDRMFNTTDAAAQKQLAYQMQDYYAGEMPVTALYAGSVIQPYNKKYEGWVSDPIYGILSYGTFFGLHEA